MPPPPPPPADVTVVGAREHNLRDLSVRIPHHRLTVVTGVSGSGKSTLAFDIVFAEGQRRFLESMSPYARQFVEQLARPAVDRVEGIPPTVAIEQRITRGSRKSTVATITEVAQYLRLLYARVGRQHHPESGRPVRSLTAEEVQDQLARFLRSTAGRTEGEVLLCAPLVRRRKGHHEPVANWARDHGYAALRIDGRMVPLDRFERLDRYVEHDVEVMVARLPAGPRVTEETVAAPLATALRLGRGAALVVTGRGRLLRWFSSSRTDAETGESFPDLDPKDFSFNSPKGWCPECRGHGRIYPWMEKPDDDDDTPPEVADLARDADDAGGTDLAGRPCPVCAGERLNRISRAVRLRFTDGTELTLPQLLRLPAPDLLRRLGQLDLDARGRLLAADLQVQIGERLRFMEEVGLGYLSLDRPTNTLSGGEAQRIRLAASLGSALTGVLYVLDEPSIGLHARDNDRLIATLGRLRDRGNSVLVVEHDDAVMERADHIIDLGPGAGVHGGRLLAAGTFAEIRAAEASLTGRYLAQGIPHPIRGAFRPVARPAAGKARRRASAANDAAPGAIELSGVNFRNLRGVSVTIPKERLTLVSGVSGAGKSTLVREVLGPVVTAARRAEKDGLTALQVGKLLPAAPGEPGVQASVRGCDGLRAVIEVDQNPIGKTLRSTPATYLGAFDLIRDFFATVPEARLRGYGSGRFSFNTAGGRCERCAGAGRVRLEMSFLPETFVPCDDCRGRRYGPDLLEIRWRGRSIADILELSFEEAADFFSFHSQLRDMLGLMVETGLGYLTLGQSSPTLSGGEAQRLKLATELVAGLPSFREKSRGLVRRNLYLLEEPTIGLHLSDCEKLIRLLHRLVDQGHTVVVIEHHLDLLAEADYLIELGPEAGAAGGRILYQGPLAGLAECAESQTAPYLTARFPHLFPGGRPGRSP